MLHLPWPSSTSVRLQLIGFLALLLVSGIVAERVTCAWHAQQVAFAADGAARAGIIELAHSRVPDQVVLTAVQHSAEMSGFGPASGARVSATISPDRKSVSVSITNPDIPCLLERLGLVDDGRTAHAEVSLGRPIERQSRSPCWNLFPC